MSTIEDRITEAHDNFINGRFMNAARILQSPIHDMASRSDIKDFLDAIYMSHFRLVALHRADHELELVSTLSNMSKSLLEFAAKRCMQNVEKPDLDMLSKIQFMGMARGLFHDLGMDQEEESLRQTLISSYLDMSARSDGNEQIEQLHNLMDLLDKDDPRYSRVTSQLISTLNHKAADLRIFNERERKSGGILKDIEECSIYLEIAQMLGTENIEQCREYLLKALYSTETRIFHKYDFPKFENREEIHSYLIP